MASHWLGPDSLSLAGLSLEEERFFFLLPGGVKHRLLPFGKAGESLPVGVCN